MADTASIEYKSSSCVLTQSMASILWNGILARISKTSIFEAPKFSQNFSPCVRWVLPAGSALGRRFPRQNTAAFGSREWLRCGCRAAYRGQGGGGCAEWKGPRPRTRTLGENLLRLFTWGSAWNVDGSWVHVFNGLGYCFDSLWKVCQNLCTNVWCCILWSGLSFPTLRIAFDE